MDSKRSRTIYKNLCNVLPKDIVMYNIMPIVELNEVEKEQNEDQAKSSSSWDYFDIYCRIFLKGIVCPDTEWNTDKYKEYHELFERKQYDVNFKFFQSHKDCWFISSPFNWRNRYTMLDVGYDVQVPGFRRPSEDEISDVLSDISFEDEEN